MTNTRQRLPPEVFEEVFQFVLSIAADKKLLSANTVGVDSTLLEIAPILELWIIRVIGRNLAMGRPASMRQISLFRTVRLRPLVQEADSRTLAALLPGNHPYHPAAVAAQPFWRATSGIVAEPIALV